MGTLADGTPGRRKAAFAGQKHASMRQQQQKQIALHPEQLSPENDY
jgi:hypothetical protein